MLEPYDGKLSRTVLRGEEGRKPLALPGAIFLSVIIDPRLTFHQRLVGVIRTPYLLSFC